MTTAFTPGPWRADGEPWNRIVWSGAGNRVCFMAHSNGLDDARDIATSHLIAAAPDLFAALEDLLAAYAAPDQRLCCGGQDCGCQGATTYQQAEHYARVALAKARALSPGDGTQAATEGGT